MQSFCPAVELPYEKIITIKNIINEVEGYNQLYAWDHVDFQDKVGSIYSLDDNQLHNIVAFKSVTVANPSNIESYRKFWLSLYDEFKEAIQKGFTSSDGITFCGYGSGGILAALAVYSILEDSIISIEAHNIRLITFSSPAIINNEFVDRLTQMISLENIINFCPRLREIFPTYGRPLGIQAKILPSEQMLDMTNNIFSKLYLPSDDTIRAVVSHYQYGYYARQDDLDDSPELSKIGEVPFITSTRGLFKLIYNFILPC